MDSTSPGANLQIDKGNVFEFCILILHQGAIIKICFVVEYNSAFL